MFIHFEMDANHNFPHIDTHVRILTNGRTDNVLQSELFRKLTENNVLVDIGTGASSFYK